MVIRFRGDGADDEDQLPVNGGTLPVGASAAFSGAAIYFDNLTLGRNTSREALRDKDTALGYLRDYLAAGEGASRDWRDAFEEAAKRTLRGGPERILYSREVLEGIAEDFGGVESLTIGKAETLRDFCVHASSAIATREEEFGPEYAN